MDDEKSVQAEDVSKETPSTEAESPTEQPFTEAQEAKLQEMVAGAAELARKSGYEQGSREMQGTKDREVASQSRRAQDAEGALQAYKRQIGELDPDKAKDLRLSELEARDRQSTQRQYDEEVRVQYEKTLSDFNAATTDMLTGLGIDPSDKRIEWGEPSESLTAKYQRISKKAIEILNADSDKKSEKEKQKAEDLVAQERKEQGLDSPDTGTGSTVPSMTMPTDEDVRAAGNDPTKLAEVRKRMDDFWKEAQKHTDVTQSQ